MDQSEDAISVRCAGFGKSHDQFVLTDPRIQAVMMSQWEDTCLMGRVGVVSMKRIKIKW